jgi:hypothetical protein
MPKLLKMVATDCMDLFYRNYKADNDFFDLSDFIEYTGNTISGIYQKAYDLQYQMNRQERKDEIITFDSSMLSEQELEVKDTGGQLVATIKEPIMAFMGDNNTSGIQEMFIIAPVGGCELMRTSISARFQLQYLPYTNRVYWYGDRQKIVFVKKGNGNVKTVRVLYVPSMYTDALIPEGIVDAAINQTVLQMKNIYDNTVVKKSLNENQNKTMETEIDLSQISK